MDAYSVAVAHDRTREEQLRQAKPCRLIHDLQELISVVKEEHEWNDITIL